MLRHLRIAILPLVAALIPIPYSMAQNVPMQSWRSTNPNIILVERYDDIRACQQRCKDHLVECYRVAERSEPEYWRTIKSECLTKFEGCYRDCLPQRRGAAAHGSV